MARMMLTYSDGVYYDTTHSCESTEPPSARMSAPDVNQEIAGGNLDNQTRLAVYPNPTRDLIHVAIELGELDNASIRIIDHLGVTLKQLPLRNGVNDIETTGLASGIYYYNIKVNGIVKQSGK